MIWKRLPTLILIAGLAATSSGCSPFRIAGSLGGSILGAQAGKAFPTPRAKTVVKPRGGSFCGTMTALGWPLKATSADHDHLAALTRQTKIPIMGAQLHGREQCKGWR